MTGTFDDWSKSEKLAKSGDHFAKDVALPSADEKIYYKVCGRSCPLVRSNSTRNCRIYVRVPVKVEIQCRPVVDLPCAWPSSGWPPTGAGSGPAVSLPSNPCSLPKCKSHRLDSTDDHPHDDISSHKFVGAVKPSREYHRHSYRGNISCCTVLASVV